MNVTRKQIKAALTSYEGSIRAFGRSTDLEMRLYEALSGVVRGRIIDEPPVTAVTYGELDELPPGSVITSPLPDTESNVAEKSSDRFWLMTGEEKLFTSQELAMWADRPFVVLRRGYGHEQ